MWDRFAERSVLLVALLLTSAAAAHAQDALRIPRERVLAIDMRLDDSPTVVPASEGTAGTRWTRQVKSRSPLAAVMAGIRIRVRVSEPVGRGWTLRITSAAGSDTVAPSMLGPSRAYWTDEWPTDSAVVEMRADRDGPVPAVQIDYAYHVVPTEQQAIVGKNQLMSIAAAPLRIRNLAPPVVRLRFMVPGQGQARCTGFMVGARLLLTNQHCISTDEEMESAVVDFNYNTVDSSPQKLRLRRIVATSAPLDYTLLELAGDPPAGTGRLFFTSETEAPAEPRPLFIIEHPSGNPKQVSIADCRIAGADRPGVQAGDLSDFGHTCDTLGGSSGSPVLDWTTSRVVGLHHFGFLPGSADPVNQAVRHGRILADIKKRAPAAYAEMLEQPQAGNRPGSHPASS